MIPYKYYLIGFKAPVGTLEEYMWEVLLSFCSLMGQAILFIVAPILGPISPPNRIFGVTTWASW
ncbi:hypothetical protein E2C01_042550 [Portunus trituberculatus]|uniref:Uncharacterized protein n=1 Tax=Portunus trituberculatus TaxID=210409 RepID=A0A5B7FTC0_PORTR|nr:hypothetical protein [Portunus trituberculatus]